MASPISIIATATNSAGGALGGLVNSITGVSGAVRTAQRDFDTWSQRVNAAQANVNDLRTRLDTLRSMGVAPNSQAFRDLSTQLTAAEAHLRTMQSGAATSEAALRRAEQAARNTSAAMQTLTGAGMATIGMMAALATAAGGVTLGGFALAVKGAADFEAALAKVQAAAGVSGEDLRRMRVQAMEIGPAFGKSAGETVEAMGELAKAGMSIENVLGGGAKAVVALATATGENLTPMAELLSKSIAIFKDTGLTAAQAADLVAKTANASAIGVGQFGFSLAAVGPIAASAGLNFEELSTAIGILGNNALVGSDGGTSLKSMLMALTPTAKPAIAAMEALGVKVFDAAGKSRDFRSVLADLQQGIRGLTDQERIVTLETIFGSDGSKAASIFLKEGVEGWDAFMGAMKEAPSVTDQANTRMGTLTGTIDKMKASFGNLIVLAGTPFIGVLQVILGKINGLVAGFDIGRADAMSNALKGLLSVSDPEKRIGFYNQLADAIGNPKLAEGLAIVTSGLAGIGQILLNGDWEGGSARVRDALSQLTSKFDVNEIGAKVRNGLAGALDTIGAFVTENLPVIQAELAFWGAELWKWVEPVIQPLMTKLGELINAVVTKMETELPPLMVAALGKTTAAFIDWITTGFGPAVGKEFTREVGILADSIAKWDFSKVGEAWAASIVIGLGRGLAGISPMNMGAGIVNSAINNAQKPGGNAEGTDFWKGGMTWVGENGPELLDLPTGSAIFNNQRSMQMMDRAMQSVNLGGINLGVTVNGGGGTQNVTAQQIMAQVFPMLLAQLNAALEQSRSQVVA